MKQWLFLDGIAVGCDHSITAQRVQDTCAIFPNAVNADPARTDEAAVGTEITSYRLVVGLVIEKGFSHHVSSCSRRSIGLRAMVVPEPVPSNVLEGSDDTYVRHRGICMYRNALTMRWAPEAPTSNTLVSASIVSTSVFEILSSNRGIANMRIRTPFFRQLWESTRLSSGHFAVGCGTSFAHFGRESIKVTRQRSCGDQVQRALSLSYEGMECPGDDTAWRRR